LRARGAGLTVRRGDSFEQLCAVAEETGATGIFWNRLYEPALVERDTRIKRQLRELGLECASFNAALLYEPWAIGSVAGGPYKVFTPFWRACVAQLDAQPAPRASPRRLRSPQPAPASLTLDELGLLPSIRWDAGVAACWRPGEAGAHAALEAFCAGAMADYDDGRNRPDRAGSSRLSPHLHFGELGPRQCLAAVRNALLERASAQGPATAFVRELGWREFAHHLLHHFPSTTEHPLDERFERFPWEQNTVWLEAWQRGRTGFPLVDAGMRELWATGWMHNRVRMLAASFLTKNLRQPWLSGARWFWDTLVDADLANNTLGWQWTAGCGADAAPFFRIFNPVLQAERHDPDRAYIRRWLPELARLPDTHIHRPWQAPLEMLANSGVALGSTYPYPIVDLPDSRAAALAAYARIRTQPARSA
jgi:deoxyribodipyrimidine photo-lyase